MGFTMCMLYSKCLTYFGPLQPYKNPILEVLLVFLFCIQENLSTKRFYFLPRIAQFVVELKF